MPEIPFDLLDITASGGAEYGVVQGRIGVDLGARTQLMLDACHGLSLGIEGQLDAVAQGQAQALLVGAQIKGRAAAEAGAKLNIKLEPNLFRNLGLSLEAGAFARAHAGGSVGLFLTPQYLAEFADDHFTDFTADLFLIFLEEVYAEAGVWGKAAFAAMADAYLDVVFDLKQEEPGFRFGLGANAAFGGGAGWDFYCDAGFRNLRRALMRSSLRVSDELQTQIRNTNAPVPPYLGLALDFSLPLVVLTAYDLGRSAYDKQGLLSSDEIVDIVVDNTIQQFQRFLLDRIIDTAISRISGALNDLLETLTGVELSDEEEAALRTELSGLASIVKKGRVDFADTGKIIGHMIEIADVIDDGALDAVKRPLTLFWCASSLGLQIKGQLDEIFADIGISNTIIGSASTQAATSLLPPAPNFAADIVSEALGRTIVSIDTAAAVDYLVAEAADELVSETAPQFVELRNRLSDTFDLTEGDLVADLLVLLKGEGPVGQFKSYQRMKTFLKVEVLDGMILGELLPRLKSELDDPVAKEYLTDVVEPCIVTVSSFVFDKLDDVLVSDVTNPIAYAERQGALEQLASGCGEVVYTVLVRNVLFFEKLISEAALRTSHEQFGQMRSWLADGSHPFMATAVDLASETLPGKPDVSEDLEAFRALLQDIVTALEHLTGPLVYSVDRRNRLHALKRDILLPKERVTNFRDGQLVEQAVAEMLLCNIPNADLEKISELSELLLEIGLDSLKIVAEQVLPSLGDFFLKLTLSDLVELRQRLLAAISEARQRAIAAAAALDEATDKLRDEIDAGLVIARQTVTTTTASIKTALESDWDVRATEALQEIGRQRTGGNALDIPIAGAMAVGATGIRAIIGDVDAFLQTLFDNVQSSTQSVTGFAESVEDIVLAAFVGVVDWSAEAATVAVDTILPEALLSDLTAYLDARADEKRLIVEKADQEQVIAAERGKSAEHSNGLAQIDHKPGMAVDILTPTSGFDFIYPASIEIAVRFTGFTRDMLIGYAKRVQTRVNGTEIGITDADIYVDGDGYLLRRVLPEGSFESGVNLLEVSWIVGELSDDVQRSIVSFVVDTQVFQAKGDYSFHFAYDPPGRDVDHEFVEMGWNGEGPLDLAGAQISDRANHRYQLPISTLASGKRVRIYTGGSPSNDQIDPDATLQVVHMGRRKAVWNNEGDTLFLTRNGATLLVAASYAGTELGAGA